MPLPRQYTHSGLEDVTGLGLKLPLKFYVICLLVGMLDIFILTVLTVLFGVSAVKAIILCAIPLIIFGTYVMIFRWGKPADYESDLVEMVTSEKGWGYDEDKIKQLKEKYE